MFWAISLACSVFGVRKSALTKSIPFGAIGKVAAVVIPGIFMAVLLLPSIRANPILYLFFANILSTSPTRRQSLIRTN